jgi:phosphoribosylformylglycinamidine synthase
LGAQIVLNFGSNLRWDALLFGESQSRVIVSISPKQEREFESQAEKTKVPYFKIGKVTQRNLEISSLIHLTSEQIEKTYREAIPKRMNHV